MINLAMAELLQSYRQREALAQLAGMDHNPFRTEGELALETTNP